MNRSITAFIALLFLLTAVSQKSCAQKALTPADSITYYHKIQFVREAPHLLSQLLREQKWTEIKNFIENWKESESSSDEIILSISVLLAIQNDQFSVFQLPCDYMYLLEDYAKELNTASEHPASFKYKIKLGNMYRYDATNEVQQLLAIIQAWSARLKKNRQLKSTELFFCDVYAGETQHPRTAFQSDKKNYAELVAMEQSVNINNKAFFVTQRNRKVYTAGIMVGSWFPTGNLSILGIHPSFGVLLGLRNKKNEYDIIWNFRFLNPTPRNYQFVRNDTMYSSNYYDGGYIGLDYTRYLIHKTKYEFGFTSAIAYDYFSVANGFSDSDSRPSFNPINVGSFDFSNGFRFKYFLGPKSYIGLSAKYHLINYCNQGGTDLSGNAFTIDLIYGSH